MTAPGKGLQRIFGLGDDVRGTAAVEAALIFPLIVTMLFGCIVFTQGVSVKAKVTDATVQVANIITQNQSLHKADVQAIMNAAAQIMTPFAVGPLTEVVTEISVDSSGDATVSWSQSYTGGQATAPTPLAQGAEVTVPSGLAAPSGTTVNYVFVQTSYNYLPAVPFGIWNNLPFGDSIYMSPRNSTTVACTDC